MTSSSAARARWWKVTVGMEAVLRGVVDLPTPFPGRLIGPAADPATRTLESPASFLSGPPWARLYPQRGGATGLLVGLEPAPLPVGERCREQLRVEGADELRI